MTDAIVSPMPRESIPEYSASLQPKAENTVTEFFLNGLKAELDWAINYSSYNLQLERSFQHPLG